jgi:CRISPR-associated protein Csb1
MLDSPDKPEQTEQEKSKNKLDLKKLQKIVNSAAALRLRVKLNSTGGDGDKVFPPTYAGGVYAVEDRRIDGKVVRCALLDSVQSQANRQEEALLDAFLPSWRELPSYDKGVPSKLPVLAVHVAGHGWITSLTAPHRIHDAIIRDSEIEENHEGGTNKKKRFRDSAIGKKVVASRLRDATALYKHCPTALIFGTWDSTAGEGLDSTKIPRAVVSEIIGVDITPGVRTASRIDPLGIRAQSATIYRLKDDPKDWAMIMLGENGKEQVGTEFGQHLDTDKNGNPRKFGEKGKPSDINHGNVTPDMPRFKRQEVSDQNLSRLPDILESSPVELRYELDSGDGRLSSHGSYRSEATRIRDGAVKPGGITMAYALHTWTLSLTQLRRLYFPVASDDNNQSEKQEGRHEAARTVLAALALYGLVLQQERGYWLRSRCELIPPDNSIGLEIIGSDGGSVTMGTAKEICAVLDAAIKAAEKKGLCWPEAVTILTPTEKLQELVRRSDNLGPESDPNEDPANAGAAS